VKAGGAASADDCGFEVGHEDKSTASPRSGAVE
jgi:hypothetical protein